jgi:hypothetical protein
MSWLMTLLHPVASLAILTLATVTANALQPSLTPLVADVLSPVRPVPGSDGKTHLVYELRLANTTDNSVLIEGIEVVDEESGALAGSFTQAELKTRLVLGGRRGQESSQLRPAQFGIAFLHVAIGHGPVPVRIAHRIRLRMVERALGLTITVGSAAVSSAKPVVVARPLRGTGYLVGDGCCDSSRHVRALLPLNGSYALAQRFAIDWEQAGPDGRLAMGDLKRPDAYRIYGREVFAPADGTVIGSRNDLPEQIPGALPDGLPLAEADGNFAILDIGGGVFVLLAHMQPDSVRVRPGDRVRTGDVLGKVGNTGNSQAPHLHLHVMNGPDPLLADGLPYVIDRFAISARDEAGTADFDRAEATGAPLTLTNIDPPSQHQAVLPLDLSIVDFGP